MYDLLRRDLCRRGMRVWDLRGKSCLCLLLLVVVGTDDCGGCSISDGGWR